MIVRDPMRDLARWVRAGKVPRDVCVRFYGAQLPRMDEAPWWSVDMTERGLSVASGAGSTLSAAVRRALGRARDHEAGR